MTRRSLFIGLFAIGCGGGAAEGAAMPKPLPPPIVTTSPASDEPASNEAPMTTFVIDGATTIDAPPSVGAVPPDAVVSPTGLASKKLKNGTGTTHPAPTAKVRVHYTGWRTDGKMFDSSVMRGHPASFGLDHVIKGWTEGVQLMVVGEQRRFWIPEDLAYKGKKKGLEGTLVFDVELLGFQPGSGD